MKETKAKHHEVDQHKARHELLHRHLDELIADWIKSTDKRPSQSTVMQLMEWSFEQSKAPNHDE